MSEKTVATIKMLLCAALWSVAGIFIKLIPWNSLAIAGSRSLLASMVIFIFMKISGFKISFEKKGLMTGLFLALVFLLFVTANKMTTAANAIVLQSTAPVFILIISRLIYKRKLKRMDVAAVVFTMAGIVLFFFDDMGGGKTAGNLVGVASGIALAFMYSYMGEAGEEERMNGIFWGNLFTALAGVPFVFITKAPVTQSSLLYIAILGIAQLGIPYILLVQASRACSPLTCSLLGMLEPLLNPVWVFIFDGERPGMLSLIGAVAVIITITFWSIAGARQTRKAKV